MSLFNEKLKNIDLKELLIIIILLFLFQYLLKTLNIFHFDPVWIYILIIFYFFIRLKGSFPSKDDYLEVFSKNTLKYTVLVVVLNIFLSYGFLYLSSAVLMLFPSLKFLLVSNTSNSILSLSLIATIIISPISEELIFRGVFINQLKLIVPTLFSVVISSLLFALLHSFGSITSAFIFAVCMAILYLKTDNILVAIFAHFLNNLIAQIIFYLDSDKILFTNDAVMAAVSVMAIISFVLIFKSVAEELNNIK